MIKNLNQIVCHYIYFNCAIQNIIEFLHGQRYSSQQILKKANSVKVPSLYTHMQDLTTSEDDEKF
ncbi:MAG: hypothetical protein LBH45_06440 [Campylobacteraceae bacterium]|nr:hypothetical protein [Campylobacteraceae bacterium]